MFFLVSSLNKAHLVQLLSLTRQANQRRVLVVPDFFSFTIIKDMVLMGKLKRADTVQYIGAPSCVGLSTAQKQHNDCDQ